MMNSRGELAAQVAKTLLAAKAHGVDPIAYARGAWRNGADVCDAIDKAAVSSIAVATDGTILADPAAYDFAEYIRPLTIIGKLLGLRRAPSRVRCSVVASGGASAYWVGGGAGVSLSAGVWTGTTFNTLKVAAISVCTKETAQSTLPAAEALISRDLTAATVQAMDTAFIDPANAGTSNEKPASVTNGAPSTASTGSTLSAIDSDLGTMQERLAAAGSDMQFGTWVMQPKTHLSLSRQRGSGGALAYPGLTVRGGTLLGLPVIVSAAYPDEAGSPTTRSIALLDPSRILLIDDGAGSFDVSDRVSIQMDDSTSQKSSATAAGTTLVSMFQTDSLALKVVRHVNWKVLGTAGAAAQVLTSVTY